LDNTNSRTNEIINPPWLTYEALNSDPVIPDRTIGDPFLGQPLPSKGLIASITTWSPSDLRSPYEQDWNLSIQHLIKVWDLSLEGIYIGKQSKKIDRTLAFNIPAPGAGVVQTRRPLPQFGQGGVVSH